MADADGRDLVWYASNPPELSEGDRVVIARATVKKHDMYRGRRQTVITRARIDVPAAAVA